MNIFEFFEQPQFKDRYQRTSMLPDHVYAQNHIQTTLMKLFGDDRHAILRTLYRIYPTLPYHNIQHAILVAYHCDLIYLTEVPKKSQSDIDYITLIIAALFHDAGHSGGKVTDDKNVAIACGLMSEFARTIKKFQFDLEAAMDLIRCTQFVDGEFPIEPNTMLQKIIRDADLMSSFGSADYPVQLLGLARELDWKISDMELIQQNRDFLSNQTMYTDVGQRAMLKFVDSFHGAKYRSL